MVVDYVLHALEREQEQKTWELWSGLHPLMAAGFVPNKSYDDYRKELSKPQANYTEKTNDEILSEFDLLLASQKGR